MSSRSGFQAAVEGRNLGSVLGQAELPLDLFPAGDDGSRTLNFPLQAEDAPRDPNALQLHRTGVYPVEVELRQPDGTRLAGFVTPVVAVAPGANGGPAIGQRLGVSWVVPMTAPPAYQADGKPDPSVVSQLRPEGRLGRRAVAIANSGVPLTIAPGPETLESWTQLANGDPGLTTSLNAMRDALGRSQVLAGAYVPVDVRSLVSGGLSAEVGPELVQGTDKLSALLGTRVDPRTEITRPANDASLARLRDAGVDRVILDGADLTPHDEQFTPAQPFSVRNQPGTTTAVGSDAGLQRLLEGDDPPALRAQRFLAGLSVVALEQPNVRRGVVVLEPDDWNASSALLESALAGLTSDHPLLDPLTVDDLIGTVPPATSGNAPVERELAPSPVPPAPVTEREYLDAQTQLDAFNALVPPPNPIADPGNRSLLVSLSSAWSGPGGRARARAELAGIDADINQFVGRLHVPAEHDHADRREGRDPGDVPQRDRAGAAGTRAPRERQARVPRWEPARLGPSPSEHDGALHRRDPELGDVPTHAQGDVAGRRPAHPADRSEGAHHVLREQRRRVPHGRGRALPRRVVGPRHPPAPAAARCHSGPPGVVVATRDARRRSELR